MQALSDDDLKGLTPKFRERLKAGETLDDLLPEAFAACREAARRTKNMRHYDVQIVGGTILHLRETSPRWSPAKARRSSPPCPRT